MVRQSLCAIGVLAVVGLSACRSPMPVETKAVAPAPDAIPVRFLITFDDGPSGQDADNTTARILDTLARNRWQNDIKAIFFVQTRHRAGGGTVIGQSLLRRIHGEGHVLALHTATARGHINHTRMSLDELDRSLEKGIDDILRIGGDVPHFIRPPYWSHNAATMERYEAHGLTMLLDDISIGDGKIRGYNSNPNVRRRIDTHLQRAARRIARDELPVVNGYIPLVLTLHDTNPTTAERLEDYLGMLIESAKQAGLRVNENMFISPRRELEAVASLRAKRPQYAQTTRAIR